MRRDYTLTQIKRMKNGTRDGKANGFLWYYYVWDDEGKRHKYSTGQTSKTAAINYCNELLRRGKLLPRKLNKKVFGTIAAGLFDPEKSPFLREKRSMGKKFSKASLVAGAELLTKHILPFFGEMPVAAIKKDDILKWVEYLQGRKLKGSSIKR